MRVITGSARGRKLAAPAGKDVRPTSDMAKGAMFNILQNEMEGSLVLDLFSGTGQLGIEALSRGAKQAVFVDLSRESIDVIKGNLQHTKLYPQAKVVHMDSLAFLKATSDQFDIALLDPPYGKQLVDQALPLLDKKMSPHGVILCETERKEELPRETEHFCIYREYNHGKAKLTVYRPKEEVL